MKTSVIHVHDMLSVLSVDGVEQRIGEVPGVESVTVNFAAGTATVRYDETRLEVADIKAAVRQRGYESAAPVTNSGGGHEGHTGPEAPTAPAVPAAPTTVSSSPAPAGATSGGPAQQDNAAPDAAPSPTGAAAPAADAPARPAPAATGHEGHAKPGAQPAMSADMAHEMGHSGKDLPAMVRDMRNRFWICLISPATICTTRPQGWRARHPSAHRSNSPPRVVLEGREATR